MLEIAQAREIVLGRSKALPAQSVVLSSVHLGCVLCESTWADRDKSMMDGYAVRADDCATSGVSLTVIEQIAAGELGRFRVEPGQAVRIFTGAPIPDGADAVVKQEDTTAVGNRVTLSEAVSKIGQNILRRGSEMRTGDEILPVGHALNPASFGLLATIGQTMATIVPRPQVAVLATGNELVEASATPTGPQIRNSNGPMLVAQARRAGAVARDLGIAPDEETRLKSQIDEAIQASNVLILAGGVSVGTFDLVPAALKSLGVEIHFHHVRMKPGKPLLFGTREDQFVFGLPGNPVSSFVGFELFVRPALRKLAGHGIPGPQIESMQLTDPLKANHDRPTYQPARIVQTPEGRRVQPLPWIGSADLRSLATADALLVLPPGAIDWPAGHRAEVLELSA
jgi:molybdopterin molybdotransferase